MPKVKPLGRRPPLDYEGLPLLISLYRFKSGVTVEAGAKKVGVAVGTHRSRMNNPGKITLAELCKYMEEFRIPPEEIMQSLGIAGGAK